MRTILGSSEWICGVCEPLGIDPSLVTRIVVDARAAEPVIMHVFFVTDSEVGVVDLSAAEIHVHTENTPKVFLEL